MVEFRDAESLAGNLEGRPLLGTGCVVRPVAVTGQVAGVGGDVSDRSAEHQGESAVPACASCGMNLSTRPIPQTSCSTPSCRTNTRGARLPVGTGLGRGAVVVQAATPRAPAKVNATAVARVTIDKDMPANVAGSRNRRRHRTVSLPTPGRRYGSVVTSAASKRVRRGFTRRLPASAVYPRPPPLPAMIPAPAVQDDRVDVVPVFPLTRQRQWRISPATHHAAQDLMGLI